jgi:hypothetical protein
MHFRRQEIFGLTDHLAELGNANHVGISQQTSLAHAF